MITKLNINDELRLFHLTFSSVSAQNENPTPRSSHSTQWIDVKTNGEKK